MKPITIALPGEKRNAKNIKDLLRSQGLIGDAEYERDIFDIQKLGVRAVSMRATDALDLVLSGKIIGVLNGMDLLTERAVARRMKIRVESEGTNVFSESILGYDPLPPKMSRDIFSDKENTDTNSLSYAGVFDTLPLSRLRLLVRQDEDTKLEDLEKISRRGEIITSYPYLVRAILSRVYGGGKVGSIQSVDGKVESLLASGYGQSAVDIVDTGETARKNNLTVGPTLFTSYPAFLISDRDMTEDVRVRSLANAMTDLSNELYYNSPEYREKYPTG